MDVVKTVIAALVVSTFAAALPVSASEPTLSLRGTPDAGTVRTVGKDDKATASTAEAAPTRKIRVVLASPFGN